MSHLVSEAAKVNLLDAVNAERGTIEYRGYHISYWAKPIPDRRFDWDYVHADFDWAPDGPDHRSGSSASLGAAMAAIDEQIEDEIFPTSLRDLDAKLQGEATKE